MNVKKLTFGTVALLGLGLAITLNSFSADKKVVRLKYQYTGLNAAGTTTISNWTDVSAQENPTGCSGEEIPCLVEFDNTEYSDMAAFISAHNTPALINDSGNVSARKDQQ